MRNISLSRIPGYAVKAVARLEEAGHSAYLVGGCVRDLIAGREPKDWDLATSAIPAEVTAIFEKDHLVLPTGEKHGTMTVMFNSVPCEITTFRTDGEYDDGRRPNYVVYSKSIEEDLSRRDFTMNAIAYNPRTDVFVDPYNGHDDIMYSKVIKAVGDPIKRFGEDALRMMRMVRFSCQLGFRIDNRTLFAAARQNELIKKVSMERIRDELDKILVSNRPSEGVGTLYMAGLLDHFMPELSKCAGFDQHNPHHDKDVFDHIMAVLDATPPVLKVRLAALFHDIAKPDTFELVDGRGRFYGHDRLGAEMTVEIMNRLKFPPSLTYDVMVLVDYHMARVPKLRPKNIKRLINKVHERNIWDLIHLSMADIIGHKRSEGDTDGLDEMIAEVKAWEEEKPPMKTKDLAISGKDLIEFGIKPGPFMGYVIMQLMEHVLDKPDDNRADILISIVTDSVRDWEDDYEKQNPATNQAD